MSNEVSVFNFDGRIVRTVLDNVTGEILFAGKDVAEALGYAKPSNAVNQHCKGAPKQGTLDTSGGMQELRIINEADVFRLIMSSKLPNAQEFEQWVFEVVLPSIRKTGSYVAPKAVKPVSVSKVAQDFKGFLSIAGMAGLEGNQAILAANKAVEKEHGRNMLSEIGATHLLSASQERDLTPSDLAKRVGVRSAQAMNKILVERGYQKEFRDAKKKLYYEPTQQGREFATLLDTGKLRSSGAAITQLKWKASIIRDLRLSGLS